MLRLTGGSFRGRVIHAPHGRDTRPSHSRLREALFNVLQFELDQARVLDLFAGSGALGFEALSRGASSVVFVENHRAAIQVIRRNAQTLEVTDRITLLTEPVPEFARRAKSLGRFDIIFADPPYAAQWEERLLAELPWAELLSEGGRLCLEWSAKAGKKDGGLRALPDETAFLVKTREKNYGDSWLTVYELKPSANAGGQ